MGREGSKSQEKRVTTFMDAPFLACSLPLLRSANQRCWCQQPSDDSLSVKSTTTAIGRRSFTCCFSFAGVAVLFVSDDQPPPLIRRHRASFVLSGTSRNATQPSS